MKKHDEGYVMILVLVVMIVMGLVTASILTFSLRNLQNQQLSIERMADKYAAQGEIEKKLNQIISSAEPVTIDDVTNIALVDQKLSFTIIAEKGTAKVTCTVTFQGVTKEGSKYVLSEKKYTIDSYKVAYTNPEEVTGE